MKENKKKISSPFNKDIPFFFSTYYEKKNPLFLSSSEKEILPILYKNLKKAHQKLKKISKNDSYKLQLLKIDTDILLNNIPYLDTPNIKIPFYAPRALKAKFLYQKALFEIYQTDLLNASNHLSKALKIFKRKKYYFECGECFLAFAKVYKICGNLDISRAMLYEAENIFLNYIKVKPKLAEIKAYHGLNELMYENYENAIKYFECASKICQKNNYNITYSNILNWKALALFKLNQLDTSKSLLNTALEIPKISPYTKAFSYDLLARIYKSKNKLKSALKYIELGLSIAKKLKNEQDLFELNYLKAEVLFLKKDNTNSKAILTQLIEKKSSPKAPYFKANAYTLLGIISLNENNLKRAQNLFKLALDLENSKSRELGLAIDYNNIAEVFIRQKDITSANKYLNLALENAIATDNKPLIEFLKNKLNKI